MRLPKLTSRKSQGLVLAVLVVAAFWLGRTSGPDSETTVTAPGAHPEHTEAAHAAPTVWTCSMHPQIRLPKPGKCPLCGMDLIPATDGQHAESTSPRQLVMTEEARELAKIQTVEVRHARPVAHIRMNGKVDYDETRLVHVTAWVPGRLDKLYVDFTGIQVRKGDHMVYLYSPDLLAAQQELLEAKRAVERLRRSDIPEMQTTAQATLEAARDKLRLWGLTAAQIAEIERRQVPQDHLTIYAPAGGVVVRKHVNEGMYVDTGTRIYTIADLSTVWLKLDAYESDLSWIRYGQEVIFETEAYPGEWFQGRIAFIDPILDERTRTIKVRVNVDNKDLRLKPGMFVRALVHSTVDAAGHVMDPQLAGKWICPMHPDVIRDRPGPCDQCGMDLVSAESLGYVTADDEETDLIVPASAVLQTGKRAVVYVELPDTEKPTYEGREILLGPRAGDFYVVKSGLAEGERVVVNGAFKIDSALQIQARPSMMSPEGGVPQTGHAGHGAHASATSRNAGDRSSTTETSPKPARSTDPVTSAMNPAAGKNVPAAFVASLASVYDSYFEAQAALAEDRASDVRPALDRLLKSARGAPMKLLGPEAHSLWMSQVERLSKTVGTLPQEANVDTLRAAFREVSSVMIEIEQRFGHPGDTTHYRLHCPMAFDNAGADWLQASEATRNPYFGAAMLQCGVVRETWNAGASAHDEHEGGDES